MNKNRIINILIILAEVFLFILVFVIKIPLECQFQRYFGICCPACGMGRAFFRIINLDFVGALKYNIISIPLFIFIVVFTIGILLDILNNTGTTIKKVEKLFSNKYFLLISILVMIISYIYNLTRY